MHFELIILVQGKRHLTNQPINTGTTSKGGDVKSQLANAILHGEGSARERLRMRKAQAQLQAQGEHEYKITFTS